MNDKSATLSINVAQTDEENLIKSFPLNLEVNFFGGEPQFDMTDVKVPTLTCSVDDASWRFPLPPAILEDQQEISFTMISSEPELLTLNERDGVVILESSERPSILRGETCPTTGITFVIELESNILGTNEQEFTVPVRPKVAISSESEYNVDQTGNQGPNGF